MTQRVIAVFDTEYLADAAVQDLEVARIPSAIIQRYAVGDPEQRLIPTAPNGQHNGCPLVTVTVDEVHTEAVAGILDQHGAVEIC
jgi:hypothetical protein